MSVQQAVEDLCSLIGEGAVRRLDDQSVVQNIPRISSGSPKLDHVLGGGWPIGRMVEIYGNESSGKSTLVWHAIAEMQKVYKVNAFTQIIDTENAVVPEYAKALGVNTGRVYLNQPTNGDEVFKVANKMVCSGSLKILVLDSIAGIVPREVQDNDGSGGTAKAPLARLLSVEIPILNNNLTKYDVLGLFTNQVRTNPGQTFGNPEYAPGGKALPFYASIRLNTLRLTATEEENDVKVSNKVRCRCLKNKVAAPFKQTDITIRYGSGVDVIPDLVDECIEHDILMKRGSHFYKTMPNGTKPVKIAQGRTNLEKWIRENEDKRNRLIRLVNKAKQHDTTNDK